MKKATILFAVLTVAFNVVNAQTVFGFENASENGDTIEETIDGITVTISGDPSLYFGDAADFAGSSGNVVATNAQTNSVTFTFNQAVDVNSILPLNVFGQTLDYTFTPTGGGANSPVVVPITSGSAPGAVSVDLNWTNVTSFTVSASELAAFTFDNLSVAGNNSSTIFGWETAVDVNDEHKL
ncbi:hypothetical protein Q4Q35_09470, partial [Flavivirga aquimarina]